MIKIITDSTSDISPQEAAALGVEVVPLKVVFGGQAYRDGIDMDTDAFYKKLAASENIPTTSQPPPEDFLTHFNEARKKGDSVIAITLSGKLSGTVQSANLAKKMSGYENVHVIDSGATVIALRQIVMHALSLVKQSVSVSKILTSIEDMKLRQHFFTMIDTFEYLYKGGRLSKSAKIAGTLLTIKPLLTLKEGGPEIFAKARGVSNSIKAVLNSIALSGGIDTDYPVYLGYTAENSKCLQFKEKLLKQYAIPVIEIHPVGCVVGTHVGPGAFAISYVSK